MTLVSVVIPTFNRRDFVVSAVNSVLAQTYQPIEIVVVDDGSSDGTVDALHEAFGNRVRVVALPQNLGRSTARNKGWELAQGELVAFLDADDIWLPEKIAKQVPAFADPRVSLVHTWAGKIDVNGNALEAESAQMAREFAIALKRGYDYGGITETWCRLYTSAAMVRRSALSTGGFDPGISSFEDWDVLWRIARDGRVVTIAEQLLLHRRHEGNTPTVWANAAVPWVHVCARHLREMPASSSSQSRAELRRARHNLLLNLSLGEFWRRRYWASRWYMWRALLVSARPLREPTYWVWGAPLVHAFLPRLLAGYISRRLPVDQYVDAPTAQA